MAAAINTNSSPRIRMLSSSGKSKRPTMLVGAIFIITSIYLNLVSNGVLASSVDKLYYNPKCGSAPLNTRKYGVKQARSEHDLIPLFDVTPKSKSGPYSNSNSSSNLRSDFHIDPDSDWDSDSDSDSELSGSKSDSVRRASGYIMNSVEAKYGDWPSMVMLDISSGPSRLLCGGVLVSTNEIWTAGHCVDQIAGGRRGKINIGSGESGPIRISTAKHNRKSRDAHQQTYIATTFYLNERFQETSLGLYHDWARIFPDRPIALGDHVQPACVRRAAADVDRISRGACYVAGFGAIHYLLDPLTNVLNRTYPDTQQFLSVKRIDCSEHLHESNMCFGASDRKNRSPCPGDSGSPVLCLDEQSRWNVVALVSSGPQCDSSYPRPTFGTDAYAKITNIMKTTTGR